MALKIYKGLESPKQMLSYRGSPIRFNNGIFSTEDEATSKFLDKHPACENITAKSLEIKEKK